MNKKNTGLIALIMATITAAAVIITVFTGVSGKGDKRLNIVASFYPMYSAALRITQGVDGADVINLTPNKTGCLHDYQLTPDDVISLKQADALVINGAGAESFIGDLDTRYPDLNVIDTSAGIELIVNSKHSRDEDEHRKEGGHEHEELYNEHIWTSASNYIRQIETLRDGLIRIDPDFADQYRANAEAYIKEIKEIEFQLQSAVDALPTKKCIIFHGSLEYFAQEMGLTPIASFSADEETGISAADLAKASEAASAAKKVLLLYDSQYDADYTFVVKDVSYSRVLKLDTDVIDNGGYAGDSWLSAMKKNLNLLKEAAK